MFVFMRCWLGWHVPSRSSIYETAGLTTGRCRCCGHALRLSDRGNWVRRRRRRARA